MHRDRKVEVVGRLSEIFSQKEFILVVCNKGLSVAEVNDLRRKARDASCGYVVAKNRLTKIALKGSKYEPLSDIFKGPTSIAYSDDPVATAKLLTEFSKENENVEVIGGMMQDKVLDSKDIKTLSLLPSLDEIRAQLASLIALPAVNVASVLQAPGRDVVGVLKSYSEKGE